MTPAQLALQFCADRTRWLDYGMDGIARLDERAFAAAILHLVNEAWSGGVAEAASVLEREAARDETQAASDASAVGRAYHRACQSRMKSLALELHLRALSLNGAPLAEVA